jgi:transcriptional regulator with XRE-family HTH domain
MNTPEKSRFGERLQNARERAGWSQKLLSEKAGISRVTLASWESGNSAPDSGMALKLAKELDADAFEFFLLATHQKAVTTDSLTPELQRFVIELLEEKGMLASRHDSLRKPAGHLSLVDSLRAFSPMVMFTGDKREDPPKSAGDLLAFSNSSLDERWLCSLRLPPDTEKISDKVIMTAPEKWLRENFGNKHILCIGSGAANLYSREFNDSFLFRFNITRASKASWEENRDNIKRMSQYQLVEFAQKQRDRLKYEMHRFKPPGFVDYNYRYLTLGVDLPQDMDFGVVSLGRNPWAAKGDAKFAILAAGVHLPGTAHAVKFLADPKNFEDHPFGGVIDVEVPAVEHRGSDIPWYEKIGKCKAYWHSAGSEPLAYTPEKLRKNLSNWLKQLEKGQLEVDVALNKAEIERHIETIDLLANAKVQQRRFASGSELETGVH